MPAYLPADEIREKNAQFADVLARGGDKAAAIMDEPVRALLLERSFAGKFVDFKPVSPQELVRDNLGAMSRVGFTFEPEITGAVESDSRNRMQSRTIGARTGVFEIGYTETPEFVQNTRFLRLHDFDMMDTAINLVSLNLEALRDVQFINMVETACVSAGSNIVGAGMVPLWKAFGVPWTRVSFHDMMYIGLATRSSFPMQTCLTSILSYHDASKSIAADGGVQNQLLTEVVNYGWAIDKVNNVDVNVSIKKRLLPNGRFYGFYEPKKTFIGRSLEEPKVKIKADSPFVTFSASEAQGIALARQNAVSIGDYVPTTV